MCKSQTELLQQELRRCRHLWYEELQEKKLLKAELVRSGRIAAQLKAEIRVLLRLQSKFQEYETILPATEEIF